MNLKRFQEQARRTMNEDTQNTNQYLNMAMGLVGEVGELVDLMKKEMYQGHKKPDYAEEIGDIMWYLVNYARLMNHSLIFRPTAYKDKLEHISTLLNRVNNIFDGEVYLAQFNTPIKRNLQGSVLEDLRLLMQDIYSHIITLSDLLKVDLDYAKQHNIDKLQKRYPQGFDADRSVNR